MLSVGCGGRREAGGSIRLPDALSATLEIELSEPTSSISEALENQKASSTAKITSVRLRASMVDGNDLRDATEEELNQLAFDQPEIELRSYGDAVTHRAPNGASFTLRDLLSAIEETERRTRHQSEWFGGIDAHHVFFEGLEREPDGVWQIGWGS